MATATFPSWNASTKKKVRSPLTPMGDLNGSALPMPSWNQPAAPQPGSALPSALPALKPPMTAAQWRNWTPAISPETERMAGIAGQQGAASVPTPIPMQHIPGTGQVGIAPPQGYGPGKMPSIARTPSWYEQNQELPPAGVTPIGQGLAGSPGSGTVGRDSMGSVMAIPSWHRPAPYQYGMGQQDAMAALSNRVQARGGEGALINGGTGWDARASADRTLPARSTTEMLRGAKAGQASQPSWREAVDPRLAAHMDRQLPPALQADYGGLSPMADRRRAIVMRAQGSPQNAAQLEFGRTVGPTMAQAIAAGYDPRFTNEYLEGVAQGPVQAAGLNAYSAWAGTPAGQAATQPQHERMAKQFGLRMPSWRQGGGTAAAAGSQMSVGEALRIAGDEGGKNPTKWAESLLNNGWTADQVEAEGKKRWGAEWDKRDWGWMRRTKEYFDESMGPLGRRTIEETERPRFKIHTP